MVSALSNKGGKKMYEKISSLMTEIREMHKLQIKVMTQTCHGLTPDQAKLLYLIKKEKSNQKELAKHLHITEATLSVRIKRLVDSGLIERVVDDHDKRIYSIILSSQGEKTLDDIKSAMNHYQTIVTKGITIEEYETVLTLIKKIQKNIKEEIEC